MAELRAYVYLDRLQPQFAAYLGANARGYIPVVGMAAILVEIAPGVIINQLTDAALKAAREEVQALGDVHGIRSGEGRVLRRHLEDRPRLTQKLIGNGRHRLRAYEALGSQEFLHRNAEFLAGLRDNELVALATNALEISKINILALRELLRVNHAVTRDGDNVELTALDLILTRQQLHGSPVTALDDDRGPLFELGQVIGRRYRCGKSLWYRCFTGI